MDNKWRVPLLIVLTVLLALGGLSQASARGILPISNAQVGTAFTYQGSLSASGDPYTGMCDFQSSLWDALSGGSQIGASVTTTTVSVAGGRFTMQLDFGSGVFTDGRWLELTVRCPAGTGTYTTLSPRQALTAAPYALSAPWSGLTGIPAGFADGIDNNNAYTAGSGLILDGYEFSLDNAYVGDVISTTIIDNPEWFSTIVSETIVNNSEWFTTLVSNTIISNTYLYSDTFQLAITGVCPEGSAIRQVNDDGTVVCETDDAGSAQYDNLVVVAQAGGDFTSIQAAIDSITDASENNRYLVWVAPGTYNEQVTLKGWVDLRGASKNAVVITYSGVTDPQDGVLKTAANSLVSDVSIVIAGDGSYGTGVYLANTANLSNVLISCTTGVYTYGVMGIYSNGGNITIRNSQIYLNGDFYLTAKGINSNGGQLIADSLDVYALTTSSGAYAYGLDLTSMSYLDVRNSNLDARGYAGAYGIDMGNASFTGHVASTYISATGTGATNTARGIYLGGPLYVSDSYIQTVGQNAFGVNMASAPFSVFIGTSIETTAYGGNGNGFYASGSATGTIEISGSRVIGATHSISNGYASRTVHVADTLLSGGAVYSVGGNVVCAGVYDEAFTFYSSTCP